MRTGSPYRFDLEILVVRKWFVVVWANRHIEDRKLEDRALAPWQSPTVNYLQLGVVT
jgi:hypothetical protein